MPAIKIVDFKSRQSWAILPLNSSPIDELGDGACQSGRWFWVEQRALSHEPWAGHTGIHGNSASGNHPPGTVTLTQSVEILANPILTQIHQWGREGKGEKAKQLNEMQPETNSTSHSRNEQHMRFEKPRITPPCAWLPDHRWPALAWF